MTVELLIIGATDSHQTFAIYTFSDSVNSPLSPTITLSLSLFHSQLKGSKPSCFTNLSHCRLSSGLRTDSTEFLTGLFLLSISFFMAALCSRAGHIYFHPVVCSFFSSPNLRGRRLDVCRTSTHGVALVRI